MQTLAAGRLDEFHHEAMARLTAAGTIKQIWSKHAEVWKADAHHASIIASRLGWLEVLAPMRKQVAALAEFAREIRDSGFRDVVLLGMGGSSLAPEVFSLLFPAPFPGARFFVLDSTDPASVLAIERSLDLGRTLFIVASKSGKTIETLSQFSYFRERLEAAGVQPPERNFVAITDAGSHLARLAAEQKFRRVFLNPADIGGRYSALSYFGLVPAALWGVDLETVLGVAMEMEAACGPAAQPERNPALALGTLMGVASQKGADKLVLLASPKLAPLGDWIEQLVAESTGKKGKGVVPVVARAAPFGSAGPTGPVRQGRTLRDSSRIFDPQEVLAEGCVVATLQLGDEDSAAMDALGSSLRLQGVPLVQVRLNRPADLGAEFFKWEVATAVAGAVLGVDPFDEPNVQESKDATTRLLEQFQSSGHMPLGVPRLTENGIELYAGDAAFTNDSPHSLIEALRSFLGQRRPGDYLALLAYAGRNPANARQLDALRARLAEALRLPVLLGYGPRYLHSIGQLYKGGPPTGRFVVITTHKAEDVAIPGAKYTFGQLEMAQALGDLESLARRGKPVLRLHLTQGAEAGLAALRQKVESALAGNAPESR